MAYSNLYPNNNQYRYGFQNPSNYNYAMQNQMMQQALMQQTQPQIVQQPMPVQSQPYDIPIQEVRFVNSDEANAFIVMPNTKVMLIDKNNGVVYVKSADAMGQSSKELYKLEKIDSLESTTPKETNFIKKDDLADFAQKADIKELSEKIERLQKQIKINDIITEGDKKNGK